MKQFITTLIFTLVLLISCKEETECDTAGYAAPEIMLISPEGDIEVSADSLATFLFSFSAEAGLNTFSMNGEPVHVFTRGETEADFVLSRYFWESGNLEFVLHDLCDQSASINVAVNVLNPVPY